MNNQKEKKLGLAINYDYPDYGGMLQAYATQIKLEKLGYKTEAINIDALTKSIRKRKIKYFICNILDKSIVCEKSQIIKKKIRIKLDKDFGNKMRMRYSALESFCRDNFVVSKEYKNWSELSDACHNYNAVLVGSDQLWLPSNIEGDYYTLSFVPDDVRKIAYATSFGVSEIPIQQEEKTRNFLNRIDFLSARETSGQKIIKKFTGRNVKQVCDPTMLLLTEEWGNIATKGRIIEGDYIFCYFMGDNPSHREFVKKLQKKTGYKVIALLHLDQYIASDEEYIDEAPYNISPADFLNLVNNAKYVCTDSFHGTVFSIVFKKNFFTFRRFSDKATLSTNTRIDSLLMRMGLEKRLINDMENLDGIMNKEIDFNVVDKKLELFRAESLKYLIDSIES